MKINHWSNKEQLESIVKNSKTWSECLKKLNLSRRTGNRERLKKYIELYEINDAHITNKVWDDVDNLTYAVSVSKSSSQVLKSLGLKTNSGNFDTLNKYLRVYKIGIEHFDRKEIFLNNLENHRKKILLKPENVLIEESLCRQANLRLLIKREKLLKYECVCGISGLWQGKEINLQLDHINGINNDNRIENLRYLCPNCHSQTLSFSGRNRKKL
jgi:5-methylcytosine-specific restriction endonuclease McrA